MKRLEAADLRAAVRRFAGVRVAVYGDLIADEFVYGLSNRISREAPVLILDRVSSEVRPGGGANSVHNLAALGASPVPVGVAGDDAEGRAILSTLRDRGVDLSFVRTLSGYRTPTKTRILGGAPHSIQQQLVRVDHGGNVPPGTDLSALLSGALADAASKSRGLLIADYGYEVVRAELAAPAIARVRAAGGVVSVDSRRSLRDFAGCSAATPNQEEAETLLGEPIAGEPAALGRQGRRLRSLLGCDAVVLTLGSRGMALFREGAAAETIPIHGTDEVADVTGAGDTVISVLTLGLVAGLDLSGAAHLANVAAGLVVMKRGTATVTAAELDAALEGWKAPERTLTPRR